MNGQDVPVYKGALAYKVVQLPPEFSRVHFRFAVRGLSSLYFLFGLCSILWLGILTALVVRTCRSVPGDMRTSGSQPPGIGSASTAEE